jgi:hypothetical protein
MQANLLNQVGQKKVSVFVKCERFTKWNIAFRLLRKNTTNVFKADYWNVVTEKSCLIFRGKRNLYLFWIKSHFPVSVKTCLFHIL